MKKHYLLLCLIVLSFIGCKNDKTMSIVKIETSKIYTPDITSHIAKVKFVPLETQEDNLIGEISKIVVGKEYIGIKDINQKLYIVDKTGKFINEIGRVGHGPDEFFFLSDFEMNEKDNEVYIASPGKIHIYGINGVFKDVIDFEDFELQRFSTDKDGNFVFIHPFLSVEGEVDSVKFLSSYNKKGELIAQVKIPNPHSQGPCVNWLYRNEDYLYFKKGWENILYKTDDITKWNVFLQIDLEGDKFTFENFKMENITLQTIESFNKYYSVDGIIDLNKILVIKLQRGLMDNNIKSIVYSPFMDKVLYSGEQNKGIEIGGISHIPFTQFDDVLVSVIYPHSLLLENLKSGFYTDSFWNNMHENSNPVLSYIEFK